MKYKEKIFQRDKIEEIFQRHKKRKKKEKIKQSNENTEGFATRFRRVARRKGVKMNFQIFQLFF